MNITMGAPTITKRNIELTNAQGSVEAMAQSVIEYFFLLAGALSISEIFDPENIACATLRLS